MTPLSNSLLGGEAMASRLGGDARPGEPQAWRREMEKAQALAWLRNPPAAAPSADAAPDPASSRQGGPADEPAIGPAVLAVRGAGASPAAAVRQPSEVRIEAAPAPGDLRAAPVEPAFASRIIDAKPHSPSSPEPLTWSVGDEMQQPAVQRFVIDALRARQHDAPTTQAQSTAPQQPRLSNVWFAETDLRVHVEHEGTGLAVWLGIDGEDAAIARRAASVLAELRRSELQLAKVVCNGRTIHEAARETPVRPDHTGDSE